MNPTVVVLSGCLLLALLHPALSLKCYSCVSNESNCKSNEKDCSLLGGDRCLKVSSKSGVIKSCSTKMLCDLMKFCDGKSECTASCCTGDLCNASSTVTPVITLTVVATLMSIAGYLM